MSSNANLNRNGRKPGVKNKATVAREAAARTAIVAVTSKLAPEAVAKMTPLDVLLFCMAAHLQAGNLEAAASAADRAAPFCHARRQAEPVEAALPIELLPDHLRDAPSDEPGPEHPIY